MLKADLRKEYLEKRRNLSPSEYQSLNEQLLEHFKKIDLSSVSHLHTFVPILANKEPDTFAILRYLWDNHPKITTLVPVSNFETGTMINAFVNSSTTFSNNLKGILEPNDYTEKPSNTIDMVLVPLLAFDLNGHRVGYGGGFYDRFLSTCHPRVNSIGISFFNPIDKISNTNQYDIPLKHCLTANKLYSFSS